MQHWREECDGSNAEYIFQVLAKQYTSTCNTISTSSSSFFGLHVLIINHSRQIKREAQSVILFTVRSISILHDVTVSHRLRHCFNVLLETFWMAAAQRTYHKALSLCQRHSKISSWRNHKLFKLSPNVHGDVIKSLCPNQWDHQGEVTPRLPDSHQSLMCLSCVLSVE